MSELLVDASATLKYKTAAPPITGMPPSILPTSSYADKVKTKEDKVFKRIDFQISGTTCGTCVQNTPAFGSVDGNTNMVKSNDDPLVRDDAESNPVTVYGMDSISGNPCQYQATVQINNAGQSKVKAE